MCTRYFFALDSRWSAGVRAERERLLEPYYEAGRLVESFGHASEAYEAFWGWSAGLREDRATRWRFGLAYERHRYEAPRAAFGRTLAYPWVGFETVEDAFSEMHDVNSIDRVEDVNLGLRLSARLGLAARAFGSDRDAALVALTAGRGWQPRDSLLLLADAEAGGRLGRPGAEGVLASASLRGYWRDFGRHTFYARLAASAGSALDPEDRLTLGGDNGLRGYPLRFQAGDRSLLLTVEQRFYTGLHLLQLFHVGAAVFGDIGGAWSSDARPGRRELLKDVGFGLRLSSSRSGRAPVVHLDVAFPLDRAGGVKGVQWLVSTHDTF